MRCIPLDPPFRLAGEKPGDQPAAQGACILCGQHATEKGIFGRAY